jgi:hypothetical protein
MLYKYTIYTLFEYIYKNLSVVSDSEDKASNILAEYLQQNKTGTVSLVCEEYNDVTLDSNAILSIAVYSNRYIITVDCGKVYSDLIKLVWKKEEITTDTVETSYIDYIDWRFR